MLNEIKEKLGIKNSYMFVFEVNTEEKQVSVNVFTTGWCTSITLIQELTDEVKKEYKANHVCCINIVKLDV